MQRIASLFGKTRDLAEFVMLEVQIGAHRDNVLERVPIEYED